MARQSSSALEVRDVTKTYGPPPNGVVALQRVSFDIRHNEFFTLLGPSGCGKTTLLRLFAGFEEVSGGEISLYGQPIAGLPPERRPVNTVFQHYALFPHMTVRDNIAYGLRRLRKPEAEIRKTVGDMLALVHLSDYADRKPSQMSGGQMQRVALARALAPSPKVLLLDEPLSALDLKLRQAMRQELQRLQRETGITFVFVTHDQDEALAMSDRIAVMSRGQVQQIGMPEDIYKRPANRFVADFIGDTNFVDAQIQAKSDGHTVCNTSHGLVLKLPQCVPFDIGTRVVLNVRPENVMITSAETGIAQATVTERTYLGRASMYSLDLGGGVTIKTQMANQAGDLGIGDRIGVSFAAESVSILAT